jgi:excinuclease ABC subunit C
MNQDPTEPSQAPADSALAPDSTTGMPPQPVAGRAAGAQDIDPATVNAEDDEEARLPEMADDSAEPVAEGTLAVGRAAIEHAVRHAPTSPGVYRMLNAAHDVLYVGKAKNVRKRLASYARPTGQVMRIARMIAATAVVESGANVGSAGALEGSVGS